MTMQGISNVLPKAAAAVAEKSEKAKGDNMNCKEKLLEVRDIHKVYTCLLYTSPSPRD